MSNEDDYGDDTDYWRDQLKMALFNIQRQATSQTEFDHLISRFCYWECIWTDEQFQRWSQEWKITLPEYHKYPGYRLKYTHSTPNHCTL